MYVTIFEYLKNAQEKLKKELKKNEFIKEILMNFKTLFLA